MARDSLSTMTAYRAKIEMDLVIQDWDLAREVALAFVKNRKGMMTSAFPGETMDQMARRVVGDDKLVADAVALAMIVEGADAAVPGAIGNISWNLVPEA